MQHISSAVDEVIGAIETKYAGCMFRSRTEARYAVMFDTLGVEWQYELQGFDLPSGNYLPDFFLPETETWVEIKGKSIEYEQPRVYFAGKISRDDWRHQLFPYYRRYTTYFGEAFFPFCSDGIMYCGPTFSGDDHGCTHGPTKHASGDGCNGSPIDRTAVLARSLEQIRGSSHMFAWIDSMEAFGTLVEIGYAAALDKNVFVSVSKEVAEDACGELWFAQHMSRDRNNEGYSNACYAFADFLRLIYKNTPDEILKCFELAAHTKHPVLMLAGGPTRVGIASQIITFGQDGEFEPNKVPTGIFNGGNISESIEAARSARFEHGVSGAYAS